ncbi:MarR family winged helix-turn-helix transcriptional regulator [Thauera chlorobenzoica]|uniref:Transcriptional regulator, MarR family n=1 Tax=Thauera chlorobenzoica TaxID=96773 RepID=A0A1H5VVF9_9RHOO|nr:MarR family winged helix-turn-helix transcriptional regulator [Thauera chlorobenzoica]APR03950.1 transcriptional regulator, MarR family [Thauera chlorobenzoica]SEF91133.1 DNA-binding transcriptional regulator, MarR family [Thauera chlorobenzoica]
MNSDDDGALPVSADRPAGVCYLIGRLHHALGRRMRDALAPLGLSVAQYTVLSFLEGQVQISNAQLAERALVSPQSANEMVKTMEARGWVSRQPDPGHGRVVRLGLTAAGRAQLAEAHVRISRLEAHMLGRLSETQRGALPKTLREVLHALSAMIIDPVLAAEVSGDEPFSGRKKTGKSARKV